MTDSTEEIRRGLTAAINTEAVALAAQGDPRTALEARYGQLWDTKEMTADYSVQGFAAPFVMVVRKSDGKRGLLMFSHNPRFYHSFKEG